jgi:mRNA-degrading endonuclease RelE of RelBE toxin-antitoxin system
MEIQQTPDFAKQLKTLTKPKYAGIYGSLKKEITAFFKQYNSIEKVWDKNYMLFERPDNIRINKIRLENELQNSGKSGGFRIIIICDKRDNSVGLLWVYPKIGPHGSESTNLDLTKKLVKNYAKLKKSGLLEKFELNRV